MLSIYTQEGCQNSVKYLGVDGESEPVVPQVVAEGPVTEQPGNQRPHTQCQLAVAAHITASTWQYITIWTKQHTHSPCIRSADQQGKPIPWRYGGSDWLMFFLIHTNMQQSSVWFTPMSGSFHKGFAARSKLCFIIFGISPCRQWSCVPGWWARHLVSCSGNKILHRFSIVLGGLLNYSYLSSSFMVSKNSYSSCCFGNGTPGTCVSTFLLPRSISEQWGLLPHATVQCYMFLAMLWCVEWPP